MAGDYIDLPDVPDVKRRATSRKGALGGTPVPPSIKNYRRRPEAAILFYSRK